MNASAPVEILIVEDNPHDLEMTMRGLQKARLVNHIHVARDGEEALDFIFCEGAHAGRTMDNQPKVILLDLKLPKIDGLEVLARLKDDPRTRSIPVVMLTSSQEQSDLLASYQNGVNSYIVKPVNFESFVQAVAETGMYWMMLNEPPATND
jgi:CheY-like chemotaxis protein